MSPITNELSWWQARDLLVLERTASVFSIISCTFIFATYIPCRRFRRPINRLIFYASWGNFLMTIATVMSTTPTLMHDAKNASLCRFQGFLIQMCLPADALWNLSIAINVYLTVFKRWEAARLKRLEPVYILFNYGTTFAVALTYLFIDDARPGGRGKIYGPANLWCWIDKSWDGFRVWLCYAPAWACILAIFVIYSLAWIDIFKTRKLLKATHSDRHRFIGANGPDSGSTAKEVRITTEIKHSSFHTSLSCPYAGQVPEVMSKRVFNPFSLDPTFLRGYDPYSVTIERAEQAFANEEHASLEEANAAAWSYTLTALLYFVSLLITWLPSSVNRVYPLLYKDRISFPFSIMAGLVLPLAGFWNAVIYIVTSWDAVSAVCVLFTTYLRNTVPFRWRRTMEQPHGTLTDTINARAYNLQSRFEPYIGIRKVSARGSSDTEIFGQDKGLSAVAVINMQLSKTGKNMPGAVSFAEVKDVMTIADGAKDLDVLDGIS